MCQHQPRCPEWPAPDHLAASLGARSGRHRITWPHGSWQISPGRAGACCAMASSCSTTEANSFLTAVLPHPSALV